MTARVAFSENAVADLYAILDYISVDNESRGVAFVATLEERIRNKLSVFPESGTEIGRHRASVFGNYVAIYLYDASERLVTVAMVTEGHRNWRAMFDDDD